MIATMPPKPKGPRGSYLCVFCVIVCINMVVIVYMSMTMMESQTQFEMLRRVDELRHRQLMLEQDEMKQYQKQDVIQRVHYRKTDDQRFHDQVFTDTYLDMQSLEGWVIQNMKEQALALEEENEKDLAMQDEKEQGLVVAEEENEPGIKVQHRNQLGLGMEDEMQQGILGQNVHEPGLEVQDNKEQGLTVQNVLEPGLAVQDNKEQGLIVQNVHEPGLEVQDNKEQGPTVQNVQEPGVAVKDVQENNLGVKDEKEKNLAVTDEKEPDIKEEVRELQEHKNQDQSVHDNQVEQDLVVHQDQEGSESVHDNQVEQDLVVHLDQEGSESVHNREETVSKIGNLVKQFLKMKNNMNLQSLNDEGRIIKEEKEDSQGTQNEDEGKGKTQHKSVLGQRQKERNPSQQGRKDEAVNVQRRPGSDYDTKGHTEQDFQVNTKQDELKPQTGDESNDQIMHNPNEEDAKQVQTESDRPLDFQRLANVWAQQQAMLLKQVNDQQLKNGTEVPASESLTSKDNEQSDVLDLKVQTIRVMPQTMDDNSQDLKVSVGLEATSIKNMLGVADRRALRVKRGVDKWLYQEMSHELDQGEPDRAGHDAKNSVQIEQVLEDDVVGDNNIL